MAASNSSRSERFESRVFHHDVLRVLEEGLFNAGIAQEVQHLDDRDPDTFRASLHEKPYVRCEGWTYLEDFERLKHMTNSFGDLQAS